MSRRLLAVALLVLTGCTSGGSNRLVDAGPEVDAHLPPDAAADAHLQPDAAADAHLPPDAAADASSDSAVDAAPVATITVDDASFGDVVGLTTKTVALTVSNPASDPVAFTGPPTVSGHGYTITATTCGASLPALASCTVSVTYTASHLGAQPGTLAITTDDGPFIANLTARTISRLQLQSSGTGSGKIVSADGSVTCVAGDTCTVFVPQLSLATIPSSGSRFVGWKARGCDTDPTCTPVMDPQAVIVTAEFAKAADPVLHIALDGPVSVQANITRPNGAFDGHFQCDHNCSLSVVSGSKVELLAGAAGVPLGFTGACASSTEHCSLTVTADASVTASASLFPGATSTFELFFQPVTSARRDLAGNLVLGGGFTLREVTPDGATLWALDLPGAQVRVAADGDIYAGIAAKLSRITPDGNIVWSIAEPASTFDISSDGTSYVARGTQLDSFAPDGSLRWTVSQPNPNLLGLAIAADGTLSLAYPSAVELGGAPGIVHLDADGHELDTIALGPIEEPTDFAFALDPSGAPFALQSVIEDVPDTEIVDVEAQRFDAGGAVEWTAGLELGYDGFPSSAAITADGTVWWFSGEGVGSRLRHFEADGSNEVILDAPAHPATFEFNAKYGCSLGNLAADTASSDLIVAGSCLLPGLDNLNSWGAVFTFSP